MTLDRLLPKMKTLAVGLLVLAVLFTGYQVFFGSGTKTGVAYFDSATSIYPHDKVRVLGMAVGEITSITAEKDRVRIEFTYDSDVPAPRRRQGGYRLAHLGCDALPSARAGVHKRADVARWGRDPREPHRGPA